MDWSLFHGIDALGRHDDGLQDTALSDPVVAAARGLVARH